MIRAESLTRQYGPLTAVDNISFTVQPGEVLGFLGPNGAGKTTTMRMLAGFVAPTSGRAEICGFSVEDQPLEAKRRLGYLPEGAPSYGEMTPRQFLGFIARVRGLEGERRRSRLDDVIGRLHLDGVMDQRIETLSKGFRRRVGLAQAIIHDPPVLILDEPTDGLDPNQKHEVRELINTMAKDKIIVISTHILEEVNAVCTRAIIIASGRIVADETPDELVRRSRYHNAVTLRFEAATALKAASASLRALPGVDHIEADEAGRSITAFPKDGTVIITAVADLAAAEHWALEQLHLESGRMDEVFRSITEQEAVR
ncbi:MAG: multidrug ABC transporter ATP-binding protein [Gammaproteobacteria bacterium]|nr:MAG: ABC transporter ATP-binding protein [Pseudomonadota bacterium]MBC6945183.1 ABC transporter ATP-binding protein [Gammaproteobacteria bacterium]MCE7896276.1 ABC transporter ATP-binding protein [Gammaproteobacteria bacterium PRO8]MDL1880793.1 ABC transporter ATP-binding protein [Gammaproteobacteria bacterium PRO2]MCQ3934050.1 ABC transporter ATP-binding protein [Gammaproteobacteria bacterium]